MKGRFDLCVLEDMFGRYTTGEVTMQEPTEVGMLQTEQFQEMADTLNVCMIPDAIPIMADVSILHILRVILPTLAPMPEILKFSWEW